MTCTFLFERKQGVLLVKFGRALTRETLAEMQDAVRRFAAAEGPCHGILDLSAVEEVNVASDFIAAFGRQRAVLHGRRRILVAPKDEVFGLSRMFGLNQAETGRGAACRAQPRGRLRGTRRRRARFHPGRCGFAGGAESRRRRGHDAVRPPSARGLRATHLGPEGKEPVLFLHAMMARRTAARRG